MLHPVHTISVFWPQLMLLRRSISRYVASRSTQLEPSIFWKWWPCLLLLITITYTYVYMWHFWIPPDIPLSQKLVQVVRTPIQEHNTFHINASYCAESSPPVNMVCQLLNIKNRLTLIMCYWMNPGEKALRTHQPLLITPQIQSRLPIIHLWHLRSSEHLIPSGPKHKSVRGHLRCPFRWFTPGTICCIFGLGFQVLNDHPRWKEIYMCASSAVYLSSVFWG